MPQSGRPARRAVSRPVCADEKNPALSVDRKLFGTSTIGSHPVRSAPAVAPHDPPRSADACRSAIGRPIRLGAEKSRENAKISAVEKWAARYDDRMGYLYSFLKPRHAYCEAWQEYRRRRKLAWIATAAMLPAIMLGGVIVLPIALWLESEVPMMLVAGACMLGCIGLHSRWLNWPCPRCGRAFHNKVYYCGSIFDTCKHCGLERYAPCDPAEQVWEFADHTS
jgi:hypothetical protein